MIVLLHLPPENTTNHYFYLKTVGFYYQWSSRSRWFIVNNNVFLLLFPIICCIWLISLFLLYILTTLTSCHSRHIIKIIILQWVFPCKNINNYFLLFYMPESILENSYKNEIKILIRFTEIFQIEKDTRMCQPFNKG